MKKTSKSKEIILGVTGSIAAYKACEVASMLVQRGVLVNAVLTESAANLVGPATFEGITGRRCITELFESPQTQDIEHVTLAQRVDLFLVAPATANIIAKAALGIADDWLSTTLLATHAPILFAPAMNTTMYNHPATQANIAALKDRGCEFVGPGEGRMACRTVGPGRLIDPAQIVEAAERLLQLRHDLAGKHVLLTSGANHEPIDPVRFIGNRSSGKMGRAIAAEALARGARVTVVTGPAEVDPPSGAEVVRVETALEMEEAVMSRVKDADIVIGAAAVADYRVAKPAKAKHKRKESDGVTIELTENPDIIARAGSERRNGQIVVGFAAETDNLIENAKKKLAAKHLDLVVGNAVGGDDSAFGSDSVRACFVDANGHVEEQELQSKHALAQNLIDRLVKMIGKS